MNGTAEGILRLLVACNPIHEIVTQGGFYKQCSLCGWTEYFPTTDTEHMPDCPWLLATQYLKGLT